MIEENAFLEIESGSAERTFDIGFAVGKKAGPGDVFALSGELGTGKTCFTGGVARGLDVSDDYTITSPTFTLVNEYPGRFRLYHLDVYRLNRIDELDEIGFDEYASGKGVVVIEWAEKVAEALPTGTVLIKFNYIDENKRKISISGPHKRVQELVKDIKMEV